MSSGDDNQQGPQASTPQQIAELFNSYFVSVFTAPSEIRTLSAHFTSSHPTLNELEIPVEMVLTSLKQLDINKATGSDGIPVRLLHERNRWPDLTVPDHVIQQILAARHFSGRLETRKYCTHFQERKERLCGELPPYFHWQERIGHYIGGKRVHLILANFTTGSVHTYRNASNRLQL